MTPSNSTHPFAGAVGRVRWSLLRAVLLLLLGSVFLAPLIFASFRTPGVTDSLPLSVVGIGLLLLLIWQTVLAFANMVMVTARIERRPDGLRLTRGDLVDVILSDDQINTSEALVVIYRQGKPDKTGGPILRPRREYPKALFIPIEPPAHLTPVDRLALRSTARMYAGRAARYGFLITPDHEDHETLLASLGLLDKLNP